MSDWDGSVAALRQSLQTIRFVHGDDHVATGVGLTVEEVAMTAELLEAGDPESVAAAGPIVRGICRWHADLQGRS